MVQDDIDAYDESRCLIEAAKEDLLSRERTVCYMKIKVSRTHLRMETVSESDMHFRFKRAICDVVRVDYVDPTRVAITLTPEEERSDKPDREVIVFGT